MIKQIYRSAWDIDGTHILKSGADLDKLTKSAALCALLRARGVAVPEYVGAPVRADGTYYVLMKKMDGSCMDPYEGGPYENGLQLGRLLAELHLALAKIEFACHDADYMRELDEWILPALRVPQKITEYCRGFGPLYKALPRQLIHRDTHLGNLLFDGETFVGWLDFDNSQVNARLHDLCYMGACMLADHDYYRKRRRVQIWREIFRGALCGYNEALPLTEGEREAVPYMLVFIELTFAAFFAREGEKKTAASCMRMTRWLYRHRDQLVGVGE